jgi:hypothetical protein
MLMDREFSRRPLEKTSLRNPTRDRFFAIAGSAYTLLVIAIAEFWF